MTRSPLETTNSLSPNGQDSCSQGLLSRLWSWINSYGGLSDLRKSNAELSKQNARLAELESKLDIVLQSSDSNLLPTISTDDNQRIFQLFWRNIKTRFEQFADFAGLLFFVFIFPRNLEPIAFTEIDDKVGFKVPEQKQWLPELQIFFVSIFADIFIFFKLDSVVSFRFNFYFLMVQFYFLKL